eukprot:2536115-Pleurochrysis_carterae.AAC.1
MMEAELFAICSFVEEDYLAGLKAIKDEVEGARRPRIAKSRTNPAKNGQTKDLFKNKSRFAHGCLPSS